jgi:CRISPR/Cas system-associated exonuclease Cas4 (RecB family)
MIELILLGFFSVIVAARIYYVTRPKKPPNRIIKELKDNNATLYFNGETRDKIFNSYKHRIRAVPDFIYKYEDGSAAIVEFKSRKAGIRSSDIKQLIATAIAVKDSTNLNIKYGFVLNGGGVYKKVDLNKSSADLVKSIQIVLSITRNIKNEIEPTPNPIKNKCKSCGFRDDCEYSLS